MFNEPSQLLHPSNPVLSKARLYPSFLEDGKNFACMLVLPGGGYGHVSHQEGPPVAGWLNSLESLLQKQVTAAGRPVIDSRTSVYFASFCFLSLF